MVLGIPGVLGINKSGEMRRVVEGVTIFYDGTGDTGDPGGPRDQ